MCEATGNIEKENVEVRENSEETSANSHRTSPSSSTSNDTPNLKETPMNLKRSFSSDAEEKASTLYVINLPMDWSQKDVKKFILDECKEVRKINITTDKERDFTGVVGLDFDTLQQCRRAKEIFNGKQVEGHTGQLQAYYSTDAEESKEVDQLDQENVNEMPLAKRIKKESEEEPKKLTAPDILDSDPSGLYGLKPEFLKTLDITPPLSKWIHVSNFRCDRSELKEVLELAGRLVMCKVVHNVKKKHARAMYSHPLEAVQAISMLHNQTYYGLPLKITMESFSSGYIPLPNGLAGIGPGLGSHGQPLADVPTNFDKYLKKRKSELDKNIFRTTEEIERDLEEYMREKEMQNDSVDGLNVTSNTDIPDWVKNKMEKQSLPSESPKNDSLSVALRTTSPNIVPKISHSPTPSSDFPSSSFKSSNSNYIPTFQTFSSSNFSNNSSQAISSNINCRNNLTQPDTFPRLNTYPVPIPVPQNCQNYPQNRPQMIQNPHLSVSVTWQPSRLQSGLTRPTGPQAGFAGPTGPQASFAGPSRPLPGFVKPPMVRPSGPFPPSGQVRSANPTKNEFTTVKISNLPLSTTFPLLTEKMSEIGPVLSVQLTAPGCAVVQFHQSSSADKCYQMYNNANIMGNIVSVNYV